MTRLLYQTDSYLKEFDSIISAVDEENHGLILEQTAFYPGGGGQPSDAGLLTIGGSQLRVPRIKRVAGNLVHLVEGQDPLPEVGSVVHGILDWDRRYQLMRTHSAMHVLCGVIFRDYGASVTGGDMDPLQGRMDFEFETMHRDLVDEIETAINVEVEQNRPIRVAILPREEAFKIPDLIRTKINLLPEGIQQVRVVEIVGLDLQADGGTHVSHTSEIGHIRVVDYKSKGKINKRIYVEVE
jgi:misacylated tRNA(Ala) deacylase